MYWLVAAIQCLSLSSDEGISLQHLRKQINNLIFYFNSFYKLINFEEGVTEVGKKRKRRDQMTYLSVVQVRGIDSGMVFCKGGGMVSDWVAQSFKLSSDSKILEMCWL